VRLVAACDDVTTPRVATELKPRRKFSAHFIETNSQWISRDCEHHCRKRENKPAVPLHRCPLWVKSRHRVRSALCPLCLQ